MKLLEWFRGNAHPNTLLHVGLQPELAAGCMIRTSNRYFDMSFRKRFKSSKAKLLIALSDPSINFAPASESTADASVPVGTGLPVAAGVPANVGVPAGDGVSAAVGLPAAMSSIDSNVPASGVVA